MSCGPGADQFIERHFKDCVYNVRDYIGFCLGLAAIAFWIIAQLPQYYRNYKTKSAEALSPWFLAQWLLGDTFNLIGALLQGQQLPTTVYTAMYFVIADVFMMMQYIYYGALQRRREQVLKLQARRRHHHHHQRHRRMHQHHDGSSREQEALLGQPHSRPTAPEGDWSEQQQQQEQPQYQQQQQQQQHYQQQPQQQQQQQQQPSGWPLQQQPDSALAAGRQHLRSQEDNQQPGVPQRHQQQQQRFVQPDEPPEGYQEDDSGSCSDCSASSQHSSSKGVKPPSRHSSPPKGFPTADWRPGCSAAAAAAAADETTAAPGGLRGMPHFGWPASGVRWGGVRSVVAVGVLVAMGLVSLLPASGTRGLMVPASFAAAPQGAASARAIQAGQQQDLYVAGDGPAASSSLDTSSSMAFSGSTHSSSSSMALGGSTHSSSSSQAQQQQQPVASRGWARQQRVGDDAPDQGWSFVVGTGLGYVASVLYLCSRISQIHKNYSRKSSEGLALVMFIMAVCANLCTGTSIILRTFTWAELKEQLPWIIGSLGTISLDMIILWQSTVYTKAGAQQGAGGAAPVHSTRHHHHQHHHHSERQHLLGHQVVDVGSAAAAAAAEAGWAEGGGRAQDRGGSQLVGRRQHLGPQDTVV